MKKNIVMAAIGAATTLAATGTHAQAPEPAPQDEQVIEPDVERRDVVVPKIDTENIEVGVYGGILNIEDFGSSAVYGGRLAYHISEDFFVEGVYATSTISDSSFRNFGIALFDDEEEDLSYYNLSVGYNFFPGEVFVGTRWAMTSAIYMIGGVGNTSFADEDHLTYNLGFGLRALPTDWIALHVDARDHMFDSDILGENKLTHNFELHMGLTAFF